MGQSAQITAPEGAAGLTAYRLVLLYGPAEVSDRVCVLSGAPLHLGRSLPEGVQGMALDQAEVSRDHAVLEPKAGTAPGAALSSYVLRDLGSHNGTFVNRARVMERALLHGDVVRVGSCLLLFQARASEPCGPCAADERPLRERREHILELARSVLARVQRSGAIDVDAAEALLCHDWPLDLPELEQTVSQAGCAGDEPGIRFRDLPPSLRIPTAPPNRVPLPPTRPQIALSGSGTAKARGSD